MVYFTFFVAALFLQTNAAFAQEPLQCNFPEPGRWVLTPERTQVIAAPFPGGLAPSKPFDLAINDCGDTLVTYNMGPPELGVEQVFHRDANGTYVFEKEYQGYLLTTTFEMSTRERLVGQGLMADFSQLIATTPLAAEYVGPTEVPQLSGLCNCEPFRQSLRETISSYEYWKSVYSDPRFSQRPAELDAAIEWIQPTQEHLINLVTDQTNPVSFDDAVRYFASLTNTPAQLEIPNPDAVETRTAHRTVTAVDASAITNARTCEITVIEKAAGCGAEILNGATLAHETHHSDLCNAIRVSALADFSAPNYWEIIRDDPAFAARNEVAAYDKGIAFINTTFSNMCGVPLN